MANWTQAGSPFRNMHKAEVLVPGRSQVLSTHHVEWTPKPVDESMLVLAQDKVHEFRVCLQG